MQGGVLLSYAHHTHNLINDKVVFKHIVDVIS